MRAVAVEKAGVEERGARGQILARQLDRFLDGAHGVADLHAQIPQRIEDRLGERLRALVAALPRGTRNHTSRSLYGQSSPRP